MMVKEIESSLPLKSDGTKVMVYSNRQFSLRDYVALLSATENKHKFNKALCYSKDTMGPSGEGKCGDF